ncbi:MAG TPA: hypothetical protein VKY89_25020, partial [Thermoanaerobaculia bacterium]|nr:hypothetical protein [Thermoanaerobaculia bacterium]
DGSEIRQLAGEGYRNRLPRWSPDGSRLAFYSNRGGSYQIWTVDADGSHLAPATAVAGTPITHPIWSPDGSRLACDLGENEALLDLGRPLAARLPQVLPSAGTALGFSASAWSADGRWLAGILHRTDGSRYPGIVLYSLAERRYLRQTERGDSPCWLSDSRRLLFLHGHEVDLLDTRGPRVRPLLTAPAGSTFTDLTASADDRTLYLVRIVEEGDIWLLTMS